MSFKITKAETRLANMLTWLGGIQKTVTDFFVGAVTRTKLEAVAVEMEAQEYAFFRAIKKAIPVAVYGAFDFTRQPAARASGATTFSASVAPGEDVIIPQGTRIATVGTSQTPERVFETLADATLEAGNTEIDVQVACTEPGLVGNVGSGTITVIKTPVSGIDAVTNDNDFTTGAEAETEAERRTRFREYIVTLARGIDAAIEYGAKTAKLVDVNGNTTEKVAHALVVDAPQQTAGFVDCFVFNGSGSTSAELVAEAQKVIDGYVDENGQKVPGYKAAGVVATVEAATEESVDVTLVATVLQGTDTAATQTKIEDITRSYVNSLTVGEGLVVNELVERVMGISGLYDVAISDPAGNLVAQKVESATFTGSGTDDLSSGGSFSGVGRVEYLVEIDGNGTPDTFRWSKDGGNTWEASAVAITGAAQVLDNGVEITFAGTTGHTIGDQWALSGTSAVVFLPGTLDVTVNAQ